MRKEKAKTKEEPRFSVLRIELLVLLSARACLLVGDETPQARSDNHRENIPDQILAGSSAGQPGSLPG
jgi:hypothetical protein